MGKQLGIVPIKGTFDNLTFVRTKDGYIVRRKSSFDGSRNKTDPKYIRVQENMAEFGAAAKASKLVRSSIISLLQKGKDDKTISRLIKTLKAVQKTDTLSVRGQRKVSRG